MPVTVSKRPFGMSPDKKKLELYTLKNDSGMEVSLTNIGATLVSWLVPDRDQNTADVVLGFDRGEDYFDNGSCFGVTVGPCANRIANAEFELDGQVYKLARNDGCNNLHSDLQKGYQMRLWDAEETEGGVRFSLEDFDGSMGFPGNKKISVTYTLDDQNGLTIRYVASSDKNTLFNLTNHSYFNLDGNDAGNIGSHILLLNMKEFAAVGPGAIPTGEILEASGTPMDFSTPKTMGEDIDADMEQLKLTGGYDHSYVIPDADGSLRHIATVWNAGRTRQMEVFTTLPGVQFYTGNFIARQTGKGGAVYDKRSGFALETQYHPDSIHHKNFPSCVFGPDRIYESATVYRFV